MDVVLPYRIRNEQKFFDCAFKLGFDEMSVHKFLYMFHQSDVDTFPKMGDDRITVLIYGWELCEDYRLTLNDDEWELPEEIELILKILVPWSLDIWFSREWDRSKVMLRYGLIHCLNRARGLLMRSPDMMQINWEFLLLYNQTPWQVSYLKSLNVKKEKTLETGGLTIEMEELPPTTEDLNYTKLEQFPLIVLRLVKLFDQGSIDMVKTLCMRVLAAWNKIYHTELETAGSRLPYVPPEDKRCLLLICHIYLMAVYEADDVKGYVIDNMINNIRFYYQSFQTNTSSYAMGNLSYTPARFIALTSIHLRLQKRELFDFFIWNSSESSPVNLFGVVAQAYKSYLLGNLLMELNNMNDDYFASNSALYKRLMNSYVNEREKSEIFMMGEMQKLEAQRYAHNIQYLVTISDFKSKICKGNRMSNIGNYENTDDIMIDNKVAEKVDKVEETGEDDIEETEELCVKENELSVDPIFQNIPNNEEVLYYVYDVLSKKIYRGWQFAKIVLLFKIISHELNMLETWRYHPGLTINFMLNLETKLSQHYIDLAKIFKDYAFMEQEFWLTAFYLNPSQQSYEAVKRLGIRNNRKRNEEPTRWSTGRETIDTKYGLLSSTIDVKEIVVLTNSDDQNSDYVPLTEALHSLHLPDRVIKDILTVIFLPRNKGFSWAVEWNDLRRRCKMLMSNTSEKKRCVELTMAEANDRLKFLNIDYAKYKNRPQLDYGSIEQGYENLTGDLDGNSDESEEEEDFEDDEDVYESQKGNTRGTKKQEEVEVVEDDNSQEDDPYLVGRRRTRARTAAAMASLLCTTEITTRRKRRLLEEELLKESEEKVTDNEEKSNDSKSTEIAIPPPPSVADETASDDPETQKRNIKECLNERPLFLNSTEGFRPLIDMWNIEKSELQAIDGNCVSLLESSSILNRFAKLKSINKQNNPMSTNDEEQIDQMEMIIKHETTVPKLEIIPQNNGEIVIMQSPPVHPVVEIEKSKESERETNSEQVLETKPQATEKEDNNIKCEIESEEKIENNSDINSGQNSEHSDRDNYMEIDQNPIIMTSDPELIDNNTEMDQEPIVMTSDSTLNDNNTEIDPEPILIPSNLENDTEIDQEEIDQGSKIMKSGSEPIQDTTVMDQESIIMISSCEPIDNNTEIDQGSKIMTLGSESIKNNMDIDQKSIIMISASKPIDTNTENDQEPILMTLGSESTDKNTEKVQEPILMTLGSEPTDNITEIDQEPVLLASRSEPTDKNTEIDQEPILMTSGSEPIDSNTEFEQESGSELIDNKNTEFDHEPILMTSDSELIDPQAPVKLNDISADIVETDTVDKTINEISPLGLINEPQESLPEMSSLIVSPSPNLVPGITSVKTTNLDVKGVTDNLKTSSKMSLMDSNKNKSVAEEQHITTNSAPTSPSPLVSTEIKLSVEYTIPTDDTFEIEYLLDVDEQTSAEQENVNSSDITEDTVVLESASFDQNSDVIPLMYTDKCKVGVQETCANKNLPEISLPDSHDIESTLEATPIDDTEVADKNLPGISLSDSDVIERDMEATSSDDTKETDTAGYEQLKSVIDAAPTSEIETDINLQNSVENRATIETVINMEDSMENTGTTEVCLPNKSNFDMATIDKPLQDKSDDIKNGVEEVSTDITENKSDTEESSANINEADKLESMESDTASKETEYIRLADLDSGISAIEAAPTSTNNEASISQCCEEIKSSTNETPSIESGAMGTLFLNEEEEDLPVVDDGDIVQKEETTSNTSEIGVHLLSREEIKTVEISINKSEPGISLTDANENKFTTVEEYFVDEIIEDKAVEVTQEKAITANIYPAQLDERDTESDAARANELVAGITSLESVENVFDETPVSSMLEDMPSQDSEENKYVTSTTPELKSAIDISAMESDTFKSVVDETSADLLPMEKVESQSEVDKIFNNKKSDDMPSLYSDESKSAIDYNLSQEDAADMPTLDSEESKDAPLAQNILRNDSVSTPSLHEIKDESKSAVDYNMSQADAGDMSIVDSEETKGEPLAQNILRNDSIDTPTVDDTNEEHNKMIELCITRPLRVIVHKLRPSDLANLRQPRVRVKRFRDVETFMEEVVPKRTRLHKRVYIDVDESSDSLMSNSSNSSMYRPPGRPSKGTARRTKPRKNRTSDSDCDSNNSVRNVRKRSISTPNANSNHSNISAKSSSRASTGTSGNLVVIPRSASGLKLRISHADQKPALIRPKYEPVIVVDEIIQVSSSSNDESNTMDSILEVPEDEPDPLYEEAVIELRKTR